MKMQKYIWVGCWVLLMALLAVPSVLASTGDGHLDAGEDVEDELAMAAQNPMADLISLTNSKSYLPAQTRKADLGRNSSQCGRCSG